LDPDEFLSDYGVRSLSKVHMRKPFTLKLDGQEWVVRYEPAESRSGLFGGNSNWRGPIWFPLNYLLIESLQKFHHYFGDDFKVECPTGSGQLLTLNQIADFLSRRLIRLFERHDDAAGTLYYEYYHGDTGRGLGASHQTGWTGLIAKLIQQLGEHGQHTQHHESQHT
jgi:glycogen debranching enzyme